MRCSLAFSVEHVRVGMPMSGISIISLSLRDGAPHEIKMSEGED